MKIIAPNEKYTGVAASVPFCNGVGETDDPRLIAWFLDHGYEVAEPELSDNGEYEELAEAHTRLMAEHEDLRARYAELVNDPRLRDEEKVEPVPAEGEPTLEPVDDKKGKGTKKAGE